MKLYRFPDKGYIAGVAHGLGEHTGIDPLLWRVAAILALPMSILIYFTLWILTDELNN